MQSTAAHITDKFGGTPSKLKSHCKIIPGIGANHIERLRNPKFSGWETYWLLMEIRFLLMSLT